MSSIENKTMNITGVKIVIGIETGMETGLMEETATVIAEIGKMIVMILIMSLTIGEEIEIEIGTEISEIHEIGIEIETIIEITEMNRPQQLSETNSQTMVQHSHLLRLRRRYYPQLQYSLHPLQNHLP